MHGCNVYVHDVCYNFQCLPKPKLKKNNVICWKLLRHFANRFIVTCMQAAWTLIILFAREASGIQLTCKADDFNQFKLNALAYPYQ